MLLWRSGCFHRCARAWSEHGSTSTTSILDLGDTPPVLLRFGITVRLGVDMAIQPGKRRGRPSKGDRDSIITRPMRPLGDVVRAKADEAGMTISEYVAKILAEVHGMPQYAPVTSAPSDQRELPLGMTA